MIHVKNNETLTGRLTIDGKFDKIPTVPKVISYF